MRIFSNPSFDFIRWRWHAVALSLIVILAGLATMAARGGPPLGIDFTGGTAIVLRFEQPTSEEAVQQALAGLPGEKVVQTYGEPGSNEILIRLPQLVAEEQGANIEEAARQVDAALKASGHGNFEVLSTEIVGPVIGSDLQRKGIYATLTAIGGILVYIGLRFRFTFAVGAVVATFHDILVTLVFLTWFNYDLTLNVVAAILTITGYSVNDTIVVFDRVRENQRLMRREPLAEIINRAVNQTLSRTVITAGTTFLAVLALFLFGGEVLRGMAFTLLVGVVTGTYSTLFIASATAIVLTRRGPGQVVAQAQTRARRARA
jgi:preprotein translocase subunit SecF